MNAIVKRIQFEFKKNPDLIIKDISLNPFAKLYIIYLETVSGSDKVNDYILKNIISAKKKINTFNLSSFLAGPNTKEIKNNDEIEFYLTNGFTIIILKNKVYAIETKADLTRSISPPEVETGLNGPKDSFTENIQTNLGLIKRRIKSSTLKIENRVIGRKTNTQVSVVYFEDIALDNLVKEVLEKIEKIDIDGIIDSSSLSFLLDGENKSVYPTIMQTERPDLVVSSLLEGKIAIVVDTSCYVLIIPSFFIDFVNPAIDNYSKSLNVNFIKFIRLISFIVTILTPGFYIALINYNQEAIPTTLLINFAIQREGVPFPAVIEMIIMLVICEVLKESDLRFPSTYGSAISILGAIIIGEASVNAGLVTPIMIIVVAITFISSLIFTNTEMNNAIRFFRVIALISSAIFGLYGLSLAILYFIIYTTTTSSFGKPYFAPFTPFDKAYFLDSVIKQSLKKDTKRSSIITKKNKVKEAKD